MTFQTREWLQGVVHRTPSGLGEPPLMLASSGGSLCSKNFLRCGSPSLVLVNLPLELLKMLG